MDYYQIWCDLVDSSRDLQFCRDLRRYLDHLRSQGLIEGYRITRRKLGFGPSDLGDFSITIEVRDLTQLESAFSRVAARAGEMEELHRAVYSSVRGARFALYRDFPDEVRSDQSGGV